MYVYHVLYINENDSVMYEMIDECLNPDILVKIQDLNFMILYFKFSSLPFSSMWYLFLFKYATILVLHLSIRFDKY